MGTRTTSRRLPVLRLAAAVPLAAALAVLGTAQAGAAPRFVPLPALPHDKADCATVVDDTGVILGYSSPDGFEHITPVRWTRDGAVTALGVLPGTTIARPAGVDARGVAVGDAAPPDRNTVPVRWAPDGGVTALDRLGRDHGNATGINRRGTAVGVVWTGDQPKQAVRWDRDGSATALPGLPGGLGSFAGAINDHGIAVGSAKDSRNNNHVVRWAADGTITDLGTRPPFAELVGIGINDRGAIVTQSYTPLSPARLDPDGRFTILPPFPGGNGAFVYRIGNDGTVVGAAYGAPGTDPQAARWGADAAITALPVPAGHVGGAAIGINDRGTIVGCSHTTDPNDYHALLWPGRTSH